MARRLPRAVLSYRHAFHAGGWADVLKHAVFTYCLDYVLKKPAPLYVLDTHAGAGLYDLADAMAVKTGEWQTGVGRLRENVADPPELVRRYLGPAGGLAPSIRARPPSPCGCCDRATASISSSCTRLTTPR